MNQERQASTQFKVRHAIIGGGLHLRPGQLIEESELGEHADALIKRGALERCEDRHEEGATFSSA